MPDPLQQRKWVRFLLLLFLIVISLGIIAQIFLVPVTVDSSLYLTTLLAGPFSMAVHKGVAGIGWSILWCFITFFPISLVILAQTRLQYWILILVGVFFLICGWAVNLFVFGSAYV